MADGQPNKDFFKSKKIFLHVKNSSQDTIAELIKTFGGQIEQFLDHEVSYVVTDVPKNEWEITRDNMLEMAKKYKLKLLSMGDVRLFCQKYLSCSSSSDDDDDWKGVNIRDLKPPFIKHEESTGRFAPSMGEFVKWPEINIDSSLPVGRSFFDDPSFLVTPNHSANNIIYPNNSYRLIQQACLRTINLNNSASIATNKAQPNVLSNTVNVISGKIQNTANNFSGFKNNTQPNNHANNVAPRLGVKRRHSIYCEVCDRKIDGRIEDHVRTNDHKINTDELLSKCPDVLDSVMESLPSLSTFFENKRILSSLALPSNQEFLCLHRVDSVNSLFHSPDRK